MVSRALYGAFFTPKSPFFAKNAKIPISRLSLTIPPNPFSLNPLTKILFTPSLPPKTFKMQHHKKVPPARLSQGLQPQKPPPQKNAPLSAAVESDVVGYTTIELKGGEWYLIGNPFVGLTGGEVSTVETPINELFTGFEDEDTLYILDDTTQTFSPYFWKSQKNGWSSSRFPNGELTERTISTGQAVYIKKAVDGSITFSGKVSAIKVEFGSQNPESWSQKVVVWPAEVNLNDLKWSGMQAGDTIYTFDDETHSFVPYYWNEKAAGWSANRFPTAPLATALVKPGKALYINKTSAGIASFELPSGE